jgi:hypothetical protein
MGMSSYAICMYRCLYVKDQVDLNKFNIHFYNESII